jgi:nucleotide-binding universal stress UspA family protein
LLHVVPEGGGNGASVRANQVFRYTLEGIDYGHIEEKIVEGANVVESVLDTAKGYDLIVIGGTEEPLLKNMRMGNIAEQIAKQAEVTVILVKRRSGPLHSFLRRTVVEPSQLN